MRERVVRLQKKEVSLVGKRPGRLRGRWCVLSRNATIVAFGTSSALASAPGPSPPRVVEARENLRPKKTELATRKTSKKIDVSLGVQAPSSEPDWVAVQGGSVLFIVAYAAALGLAAKEDFRGDSGWMAAPVVGPWAILWGGSSVSGWVATFDGLAQLAGISFVALGFANPRITLGPANSSHRLSSSSLNPAAPSLVRWQGHF